MTGKEERTQGNESFELDEQRRILLQASIAATVGGPSLSLFSDEVSGSTGIAQRLFQNRALNIRNRRSQQTTEWDRTFDHDLYNLIVDTEPNDRGCLIRYEEGLKKIDRTGNIRWDKGYIEIIPVSKENGGGYLTLNDGVTRLTPDGGHRWTKSYDERGVIYSLTEANTGGFYLGGGYYYPDRETYSNWIIRITDQGDVEWEITESLTGSHPETTQSVREIFTSGNGGCVAFVWNKIKGPTDSSHQTLFGINNEGEAEWEVELPSDKYVPEVRQTRAGNYLVRTGIAGPDSKLTAINADGVKLWVKDYGGGSPPNSIIDIGDGFIFADSPSTGSYQLKKIGLDGSEQWVQTYETEKGNTLTEIELGSPSGYLLAGSGGDTAVEHLPWIMKVASDGTKEWERILEFPTRIDHLSKADDGDYLVAGGGEEGWVAKRADFADDQGDGDVPTVNIELTEDSTRIVQTVTNTRNTINNEPEPDPPIVAGDYASVAFGLTAEGLKDLPNDAWVTVSVSASGATVEDSEFDLTKPQIERVVEAEYPVLELARVFATDETPPMFEATTDLESVNIAVQDKENGSYDVDGDMIKLVSGKDHEIKETPSLSVGIIQINAPTTGINSEGEQEYAYGKLSTGKINKYDTDEFDSPRDAIRAYASRLEKYLQEEYPAVTSKIDVKLASKSITGRTKDNVFAKFHDFRDAYEAVYKEHPDVDVAIAIVPDAPFNNPSYFDYHGKLKGGVELTVGSLLQPQTAAIIKWKNYDNATSETAAEEIAHHFLPYKPYGGDYTFDGIHVQPNPPSGQSKGPGVISTGLDIDSGSYKAKDSLYSFMSYAQKDNLNVITDSRTHKKLISSNFEPHPPEKDTLQVSQKILSGFVSVTSPQIVGGLQINEGYPMPVIDSGDITLRVKDGVGEILDIRNTSSMVASHTQSSSETLDVAQFVIPFEKTAATVEIETKDAKTEFDPVSRTLSETIANLRDNAFKNNSDNRRSTLQNKLNAVGKQITNGAYQGAANKLEKDILDKLQKWLVDTNPEAANVPSKQDAINECQEMIDHVNTLAEEFGNGKGKGKGKGKGRGN